MVHSHFLSAPMDSCTPTRVPVVKVLLAELLRLVAGCCLWEWHRGQLVFGSHSPHRLHASPVSQSCRMLVSDNGGLGIDSTLEVLTVISDIGLPDQLWRYHDPFRACPLMDCFCVLSAFVVDPGDLLC